METSKKVLVVDDDTAIRLLIKTILEKEGYNVVEAHDGEDGYEKLRKESPDLVLTDIDMPKMNGLQLCHKIRYDVLYRHTPIIVLTGSRDEEMVTTALGIGSDDYIVKPFKKAEFLARVNGTLFRNIRNLDANPLTKLPGNVSIIHEIDKKLENKIKFAVLYIDLNKFKSYNDKYGFYKGDNVIRFTANLLIDVSREFGTETDFVGHVGGDDFVMITDAARAKEICSKIVERFDEQIPGHYDNEDVKRGFIICKDRRGKENQFPIMSIAIGVVSNAHRELDHSAQVISIGTELKCYAKTFEGSHFAEDRRKD